MRRFVRQLQKRKVIRLGLAYLVVAWLTLQLADVIFPAMHLPAWSVTLVLGILIVGFPLALVLAWIYEVSPDGIARTKDDAIAAIPSGGAIAMAGVGPSIAVLPFPDMSAEQDQQHFCDGLTEELLNVLTRIPGLRVASRTSSFSVKGKDSDLKSIAKRLQVEHVLEGSVRKSGEHIRVTAQLIEVASDSHLWSETYDRELDDIFAIQDDIAAQILDVLKCRFSGGSLTDPTTSDPKAYEFFLRGLGYAASHSNRDIELAIAMFQKAVELDPEFLRAWLYLAEECGFMANYVSKDDKWRQIADDAAKKASQLAPDRVESFLARGYAHGANERFEKAEASFLKAIELDPGLGRPHYHLGRLYVHLGRIELAKQNFEAAIEQDPDDYESACLVSRYYESEGNQDATERTARIGLERAERLMLDAPDNPRLYYLGAGCCKTLGDVEKGKQLAKHALDLNPKDVSTRYNVACFFTQIGDIDRALDCLEEGSIISRSWIENDSDMDPLRDHPRFKAILDLLPE